MDSPVVNKSRTDDVLHDHNLSSGNRSKSSSSTDNVTTYSTNSKKTESSSKSGNSNGVSSSTDNQLGQYNNSCRVNSSNRCISTDNVTIVSSNSKTAQSPSTWVSSTSSGWPTSTDKEVASRYVELALLQKKLTIQELENKRLKIVCSNAKTAQSPSNWVSSTSSGWPTSIDKEVASKPVALALLQQKFKVQELENKHLKDLFDVKILWIFPFSTSKCCSKY